MGSATSKSGPGPDPGRVRVDVNRIATSSSPSSSSSSSSCYSSSPSPSPYRRRRRRGGGGGKAGGVFRSFCIGSSSSSSKAYDSDLDHNVGQVSDRHDEVSSTRIPQTESESDEVKVECFQTAKIDGSDDISCVSSNAELGEWTHTSRGNNVARTGGNSSQAFSGRSLNRSGRFLSRFSFVPGSASFRLRRAASVGSSRAYSASPRSLHIPTDDEFVHLHGHLNGLNNANESRHSGNLNSSSLYGAPFRSNNCDPSYNLLHNSAAPTLSSSLQDDQIVSQPDMADNERTRPGTSFSQFGNRMDSESLNRTPGDRRNGTREPVDRNVRFSRTLSVGRLRDRVLRRSSFSDLNLSPSQQENTATSFENPVNSLISSPYPLRSIPRSLYTSQNNDAEALHPRETRHQDLLEHRSNFLERRRRIRSQVRAMQRLGNRFENLSGHERYCILSGQHRTGRCSCHIGSRDSNLNGDGGARASISRIVMLAEALFEVLDEIHQQSVVLSSQPSVSSIGSVPAPNEVVESLPVKVFNKSTKFQCEEVGQCYICLVEYEEGDEMRILPCHHEFHKMCIDKWLKEVHRVCPLCRGDICRSDPTPVES